MAGFELCLTIFIFVAMSAICSGLNLSLMSLGLADLERKSKSGDIRAKLILPLRRNSHLSLAAILLSNVAVISASSLVLEHHFNGWIAGIASTLLIVVFGEILPQALFIKNSIKVTALFVPLLRVMIIITYPVSKPLQLLLDKIFGHESMMLHNRQELGFIIGEHVGHKGSDLDEDEVEIMRNVLTMSNKRVRDIMTPLKDVYFLNEGATIDADKINDMKAKNYSRIPVINDDFTRSAGVVLLKELVDIDFDHESYPVKKFAQPTKTVGSMTALDTLFRVFIGNRSHLMPVEKDDKIIGIVTIEDLIEEILGHEIEDEADVLRGII
ncbi:MAG: CNNM domain-containing protein [Candidatus Saccharimonadales bacterium]